MNATDRFNRCLPVTLGFEGGFCNDPADPGGATNKGITLRTLSAHLGRQATVSELKLMPADLVATIYRTDFWAPLRGDDLFAGIDLITFDSAVNCGPGRAAKWLQHALGVAEDGAVGLMTLRALAEASDAQVIEDMRQEREAHYRAQGDFAHFGDGWMRRLTDVAALATSWAAPRNAIDQALTAAQSAIASRAARG